MQRFFRVASEQSGYLYVDCLQVDFDLFLATECYLISLLLINPLVTVVEIELEAISQLVKLTFDVLVELINLSILIDQ